jgi:rod shape-determining protein MreD
MSLLLTAIAAIAASLLEASLAPQLTVGNAQVHPVLVLGVVWTIAAGIERGLVWGFVGGLMLDILLGRPLGASAFALLVAVGGAALMAHPVPRLRRVVPVVAVPILSLVNSMLVYVLTGPAQAGSIAAPLGLFLPGAIYDGLLGVLLGPLVVALHDRRTGVDRLEW